MKNNNAKSTVSVLNIIGIVLMAICIPIIIFNMTLVIKGSVNKDKVPTLFNRAPLIIVSDSMTIGYSTSNPEYNGAFNKNDLIIIKKVDANNLDVGTIATYIAKDGSVVTHRIIGKTAEGETKYIMKGDNSPSQDPDLITPEQIQGVYVKRIAKLGGVAMELRKPVYIILIILVPAVIFFIAYIIQNQQENKKDGETRAELEAELEALRKEKAEKEAREAKE